MNACLRFFLEKRFLKPVCLKATASVVPQHWQPNSGLLMTNDVSGVNLEEAVPCIALSKNDSYVMSACGGKVSLFNMMTFKVCLYIRVWQTLPKLGFLMFDHKFLLLLGNDDIHATTPCFYLSSISSSR